MAARRDAELQELNFIFKSLAIRGNRFHPKWKACNDFSFSLNNLLSEFFDVVNELVQMGLERQIKFKPYGSVAEDLKYRQDVEDAGDLDVMVFPDSDNLMVHYELIEYLPENPMHVRIKGVDHPVLQSCLVEDTEYVATSALKNFHPAIYGSLGEFFPYTPGQMMARDGMLSPRNLPFVSIHSVQNSKTSPALTLSVAFSTAKASPSFETVKESSVSENQNERNEDGQPLIDLPNAGNKEDKEQPGEQGYKNLFERYFVELKRQLRTTTTEQMVVKFDLLPALKSDGWPKVAREWIKRKRRWPSPRIVEKVVQEGFHLVVKPPKSGGNSDYDFRISFSHAEYLLSKEMNDIQRECYRCLKQYHQAYLSTNPDGLTTFHLKNLLFHTIEETGVEMWTEGNRAECMMVLFGNLLEALAKKHLRHFFVSSYNLFCFDCIDDPEVLESLAESVEKIMENPVTFAKELLQNRECDDTGQVKKNQSREECIPGHGETDGTLAIQREQEVALSPVLKETANKPENSSLACQSGIEDLNEIIFSTFKELIDMASNDADCSLDALDPLKRSLVEDLQDIGRKWPLEHFFKTKFPSGRSFIVFWVMCHPESNIRCRVLAAIQATIEVAKYIMRHVDSGAPGGLLGGVLKMFYPTNEDALDWSHVMPPGYENTPHELFEFATEFVKSLLPKPAQPQELNMDDIPLD